MRGDGEGWGTRGESVMAGRKVAEGRGSVLEPRGTTHFLSGCCCIPHNNYLALTTGHPFQMKPL